MTAIAKEVVGALSADELRALLAEKENEERLERESKRKAYEGLREDTVNELIANAKSMRASVGEFKLKAFEDMHVIYAMLLEHGERKEGDKGNFQLVSDDGLRKVEFKRHDTGYFDERSSIAEQHISDFVASRFVDDQDSKDLILSLIERKKGKLDIKMIQKLYKMEDRFDDENWKQGIKLLKESWKDADSKFYINFYEKNEDESWETISINFASI